MTAKSIVVQLPTFHAGQIEVYKNRAPLNAVRCGRRFGKTKMMITMAADAAARGRKVGLFTPEHRQLQEPYDELLWILNGVKTRASKTAGTIKTMTGGTLDFWSLNDNELAGRGREYDLILIDEGAWTKDEQMWGIWEKSINPTMATKPNAKVWVFSTPRGTSPDNFFWRICNKATDFEFKEHYAPSSANPLVSPEWLAQQELTNHPDVYRQEFLAQFVDWSGKGLFSLEKFYYEGKPVPFPKHCDAVFAVMDTAVKDGQENDGAGVSFYARMPDWFGSYKLVVLDWMLYSIQGALLEEWVPSIFARLQELAALCGAMHGSQALWIEDTGSGSILLQQCVLRGFPAEPLPEVLKNKGKDGRALNVSGAFYRGEVKISQAAYDKNMPFKGVSANHYINQITGFRLGDKAAAKRADDLFDTFTYALAISLGNSDGIA